MDFDAFSVALSSDACFEGCKRQGSQISFAAGCEALDSDAFLVALSSDACFEGCKREGAQIGKYEGNRAEPSLGGFNNNVWVLVAQGLQQ